MCPVPLLLADMLTRGTQNKIQIATGTKIIILKEEVIQSKFIFKLFHRTEIHVSYQANIMNWY